MSDFKKGQSVTFTSPGKKQHTGKFLGKINAGPGKGRGEFCQVDVGGKVYKVRPGALSAA